MERRKEETAIVQGKDDLGQDIFSLLVKRTYDIRPLQRAVRSEKVRPLIRIDELYDADPEWPLTKYENDFAPFKPATDVIAIANAYAPGSSPVSELDASIEVGTYRKTVRVVGDRLCHYRGNEFPLFSDPVVFREMPIRYDRSYGGRDLLSNPEEPFYYPRNYVGRGVVLNNSKETVEGLLLPNIEDPFDLLTAERLCFGTPDCWSRQPLPDGFGWFNRSWYPRCSFTGAIPAYLGVDDSTREEKLGLVPKNQVALFRQFKLPSFDLRFNNGASCGLILPYLRGDERIQLTHLTPDQYLAFQLPGETPTIRLDIGLGEKELKPFLHTVCLRPEDRQLDLIWRGAHPYPGYAWLPEMKKLVSEVF